MAVDAWAAEAQGDATLASTFEHRLIAAVDSRTRAILHQRSTELPYKRRGWLVRRMLLLADLAGVLASIAVCGAPAYDSV